MLRLLAILGLFMASQPAVGLTFVNSSGLVDVSVAAISTEPPPGASDGCFDEDEMTDQAVANLSRNCAASASGNSATASATAELNIEEAQGKITSASFSVSATSSAISASAPSSCLNFESSVGGRGDSELRASFSVLEPTSISFIADAGGSGPSGSAFVTVSGVDVNNQSFNFTRGVSFSPDFGDSVTNTFPVSPVELKVGSVLGVLINAVTSGDLVRTCDELFGVSGGAGNVSLSFDLSPLDPDCPKGGSTEAECTCEREWSAVSGSFEEAANWSPEFVPEDNDDGCNDIILNQPGEYEITFGSGAEADSLAVLQGAPTLTGGTLTLGGFDGTALSVGGEASLGIGGGTLQADTVVVSGATPSLSLQPGATLTVVTALETGRDATQLGTLGLDAQASGTALSVAGNATLGGGGNSIVSGSGALSFNVLGDLSMAVFPGSSSELTLGEVAESPAGTVEFNVGEVWQVGGAGVAVATLEGALIGTAGSMTLGLLEGGSGTLNLDDGASLEVAGLARVGEDGVGALNLDQNATLSADTLLVSGPKPTSGAKAEGSSILSVGSGAGITVTTLLETARDADDLALVEFGGGEDRATVSVVGDGVLGGAGKSVVTGLTPLTVNVLGDLSLAVFPESESDFTFGKAGSESEEEAVLSVGQALNVGGGGTASATLDGFSTGTVGSLNIGLVEGGVGTLNLSSTAVLNVTELARVGGAGRGTLNMTEGGVLAAEDVTVDGPAGEDLSLLHLACTTNEVRSKANVGFTLIVGDSQRGAWTAEGNTEVNAVFIALGSQEGSVGSATIAGSPDLLETGTLTAKVSASQNMLVGLAGSGSFSTSGVAAQEFGGLLIAAESGSTGSYLVDGAFNNTKVRNDLVVGEAGTALVEVRTGGISAGACIVGMEPGGFGIVRVFEAGSLRIELQSGPEGEIEGVGKSDLSFPGFLEIGRKSNGIIELFDPLTRLLCDEAIIGGDSASAGGALGVDTGATFECNGSVTLGAGAGPALVRVADGATMTVASSIIIGPKGLFIAGGGASITSGGVLVNGRLRVVNGLSIERPLRKSETMNLAKGNAGAAIIDGDLEIGPDGTLEVIAGAGEALIVTGAATLDGTLEITLQPGATFTDGQLLDLIDFQGGSTGDFASVTFLNAPAGFEGDVAFEDGKLRLRVVTGGTVDPEGEGEGQTNAIHSADTDSDERVSLSELLRVIQFYNALALHCVTSEGESEDGYIAGADDAAEQCAPHDSDFNPQDWSIVLSELLQLIQLYNAEGYEACAAPEAFCPVLV